MQLIIMAYLKPVFKYIKKPFKRLKVYLKQKAGWLGIPKIEPFRGFGNEDRVHIQGMVLEDKGLSKPVEKERIWTNIISTIKRFSSDEIPGVKVKADFFGETKITETDENGFFTFDFEVGDKIDTKDNQCWYPVNFELLDQVVEGQPKTVAKGEVRIVNPEQNRIFVSDIDDTVLVSHSTQTFKKLRLMLFKNALSRLPFPGIAEFYRQLELGKENQASYPFFYVSSSEWNLYDLLEDFFEFNDIPKGIFMLKQLNESIYKFWKSGGGTHEHKYEKIRYLMEYYHDRKFILFGDSGQKDKIIYRRLAMEFPGRVETIYIRKIHSKKSKDQEELENVLKEVNTSYLEVDSTLKMTDHALEKAYIGGELKVKTKPGL
ncbi:MAG: App1 family protein [Bacteroidota bacterium]